jgi:hypothetical protein
VAKYGVPEPLVNVIVKMIMNTEISTSVGKAKATFPPSTSGVKQGDVLAPVLFLFAIQAAAESTNEKWRFRKPDLPVLSKSYMNTRDTAKKAHRPLGFNRKAILERLELPTMMMEQIITVRILRFLEKVALIPGGRLTQEVLRVHKLNPWINPNEGKGCLRGSHTSAH